MITRQHSLQFGTRRGLRLLAACALLAILCLTQFTPRRAQAAMNCAPLNVSPTSLMMGAVNNFYTQNISASGGNAPYSYELIVGQLPKGLTLNAATGALSGTPLEYGVFEFTVAATSADGCAGSRAYTLKVSGNGCSNVSFSQAMGSPLGATDSAYGMTVADFNHDGKADFATANFAGSVTVRLGNGMGGFSPATNFPAGDGALSVTAADFNHDGNVDLAVANGLADSVTLMFGNGLGDFSTTTFTAGVGDYPVTLMAADFNRDGKPDLAIVHYFGSDARILLGNGAGNFSLSVIAPVGINPRQMITADFNKDGNPDLATTNQNAHTLNILLGDGAGGIATNTTLNTPGNGNHSLAAGDFNSDGQLDLAISNYFSGNVTIALGNGAGGFPNMYTVGAITGPEYIAVSDFNGDGKLDLATANPLGGNTSVMFGDGAGAFPTSFTKTVQSDRYIAVADFDSNGSPDLGIPSYNQVNILLNSCFAICQAVTINPAVLPAGAAGVNYSQTLSATPAGNYSFALTQGNLPSGLTFNGQTGVISGLPSVPGTSNFTIMATSADGCIGSRTYALVINCPTITLSNLPQATLNTPYNQTVTATPAGGSYSYTVFAGALPLGLSLNNATGAITGTPTMAGQFGFVIKATGFGACTGTKNYSMTVAGPACPTITLPALATGVTNQFYYGNVAATPAGNYSYAVTNGALPPGLVLLNSIGAVYGTPAQAGTFNFTITATNANGCAGSQAYAVTIAP